MLSRERLGPPVATRRALHSGPWEYPAHVAWGNGAGGLWRRAMQAIEANIPAAAAGDLCLFIRGNPRLRRSAQTFARQNATE